MKNPPRRFVSRLASWLRAPLHYKLELVVHHLCVAVLRPLTAFNNRFLRRAYFDAIASRTEMLLATRGPEQFAVITCDKAISRSIYTDGIFDSRK